MSSTIVQIPRLTGLKVVADVIVEDDDDVVVESSILICSSYLLVLKIPLQRKQRIKKSIFSLFTCIHFLGSTWLNLDQTNWHEIAMKKVSLNTLLFKLHLITSKFQPESVDCTKRIAKEEKKRNIYIESNHGYWNWSSSDSSGQFLNLKLSVEVRQKLIKSKFNWVANLL